MAACCCHGAAYAQSATDVVDEITVVDSRVANTSPAGSYAAAATLLRFDPAVELQSRGMPEGQADITVQGGLFENTGFKVGAVSVFDPQTGHYAAELPIDPAILSAPDVRTGVDNAVGGFNSNIATIAYSLLPVRRGGAALLGAGSDQLRFAALRVAADTMRDSGDRYGVQVSAAYSEGDGTIDDGDHEFERYNLQLQRNAEHSQSDLLVAYQDKFYGWPGAYTGFATLPETDHTKTTLLLLNHRSDASHSWWEATAFYRELEDDYDFDRSTRESGAPGSFDHETRAYGAGVHGMFRSGTWDWNYAAQVSADELVRSTDLTEGTFSSRSYTALRLVPAIDLRRSAQSRLVLQFGAAFDASNRDDNEISPVLGLRMQSDRDNGSRFISIDYAATSQLPGYTVLKSRPAGLFGGNPDLGREYADQVSLTLGQDAGAWRATASAFYRSDDDLVDWTYAAGLPSARQANAVDIDVVGIALLFSRSWQSTDLVAGYTYLDKDPDYGAATVDASYYALNFARHRATLALSYRATERIELRLDNEYRQQQDNPLRSSSDTAWLVSASVAWRQAGGTGLGLLLSVDNASDDDYQQFPGTPAVGRQLSLSARYNW